MERIKEYIDKLRRNLDELESKIEDLKKIYDKIMKSKTIFICGNGGSSSTASHMANDLVKIGKKRAYCLTDNIPLLTAFANDGSYKYSFIEQLEILARTGDTLIILSGSGESENVIEAADYGLKHRMDVIAIVGMNGGLINYLSLEGVDYLHINTDMLHSEDLQLIINHIIAKLNGYE